MTLGKHAVSAGAQVRNGVTVVHKSIAAPEIPSIIWNKVQELIREAAKGKDWRVAVMWD